MNIVHSLEVSLQLVERTYQIGASITVDCSHLTSEGHKCPKTVYESISGSRVTLIQYSQVNTDSVTLLTGICESMYFHTGYTYLTQN